MSAEVENQELQKEPKFSEQDGCKLNEAVNEKSSWPQSRSNDGKTDAGDSSSVKSSSGGSGPAYGKDDDKSSSDSLGSGSIWEHKARLQADTVWSAAGQGGLDWNISGDGISNAMNKDGNKGYPWNSSTMQEGHGPSSSLVSQLDFLFSGYGNVGNSGGWGDSRANNWGVPDLKSEFNKEGLPDKKISNEQDRSKGMWSGSEERKVDPIGPVQRRSASLTELNVTFDSSSLAGESIKFSSTSKMGLNDERSQPDGAEVSQQNREELIAKMINSNEGWGKKPISQETPWHMDSTAGTAVVETVAPVSEEPAATKNDVFWNVAKDANSSGWNSNPPAPTSTYEWAPDSDIGMWNGPPPPESINPNMWTGPPKETNPVWLGGSQGGMAPVGVDKGMSQMGALPWNERGFQGSGMDKLQKDFVRDGGLDRSKGTDSWGQPTPSWTPSEGNSWPLPRPSDQHDNWGMKQTLSNFQSSGYGIGKPDSIPKIGTWGEAPGTVTETGLWNQQQAVPNVQNVLQQLIDLGKKKKVPTATLR